MRKWENLLIIAEFFNFAFLVIFLFVCPLFLDLLSLKGNDLSLSMLFTSGGFLTLLIFLTFFFNQFIIITVKAFMELIFLIKNQILIFWLKMWVILCDFGCIGILVLHTVLRNTFEKIELIFLFIKFFILANLNILLHFLLYLFYR